MEQAKALVDMGEHAVYIWASYGVCAVVLGLLVFSTLRRIRQSERTLQSLEVDRRTRRGADSRSTGREETTGDEA